MQRPENVSHKCSIEKQKLRTLWGFHQKCRIKFLKVLLRAYQRGFQLYGARKLSWRMVLKPQLAQNFMVLSCKCIKYIYFRLPLCLLVKIFIPYKSILNFGILQPKIRRERYIKYVYAFYELTENQFQGKWDNSMSRMKRYWLYWIFRTFVFILLQVIKYIAKSYNSPKTSGIFYTEILVVIYLMIIS